MAHPDLVKKFGTVPSFDPRELYAEAARAARRGRRRRSRSRQPGCASPSASSTPATTSCAAFCARGRPGDRRLGRARARRGRLSASTPPTRRCARPATTRVAFPDGTGRMEVDRAVSRSHRRATSIAPIARRVPARVGRAVGPRRAARRRSRRARSPASCSRSTRRARRSPQRASSAPTCCVTHHPAFLEAPERLTPGRGAAGVVFAAHGRGGRARERAHQPRPRARGAGGCCPPRSGLEPIGPLERATQPMALVTVFVPAQRTPSAVADAMAAAGAGRLGEYERLRFTSAEGTGAFTPRAGAHAVRRAASGEPSTRGRGPRRDGRAARPRARRRGRGARRPTRTRSRSSSQPRSRSRARARAWACWSRARAG